jgi:solute carrier family 25 protein 14/30
VATRVRGGQVVRAQGVASLWAGFVPMWSRVAPTATLQLLLYEKMMVLTGGKAI